MFRHGRLIQPLAACAALSLLCAVYAAVIAWLDAIFFHNSATAAQTTVAQLLIWVVPATACAWAQFLASRRSVASTGRLWLHMVTAGIGAPLLGASLALFIYLVVLQGSI